VLLKKSEKGKKLLDKLQKFWPKVKGSEISVDSVKYDPKDLLPDDTDDFFTYQGSLTIPVVMRLSPGCSLITQVKYRYRLQIRSHLNLVKMYGHYRIKIAEKY